MFVSVYVFAGYLKMTKKLVDSNKVKIVNENSDLDQTKTHF